MKQKINNIQKQVFVKAIKPFSRYFRRIFEISKIRQIFGLLVVSSFLSVVILPSSYATVQTKLDTQLVEIEPLKSESLITEQSIRLPLDSYLISQGYHFFHPGIDLAAVKGTPVYPMMDGVVSLISYSRIGYGNHVLIEHGSGLKSLYAHLAKIEVKEGEKVTKQSIVGLIGSTGRSTGPHLHLQVYQDGRWVNPRAFFEGYFGSRLASVR